MNVFGYLFNCFSFIINILDHDFFGFGFSYLDFILAASLIFIILRFLLQGFNEADRFNFFSLSSASRDLAHAYKMNHKEREVQITNKIIRDRTDGGYVHYNIERTKHPNGNLSIVVNKRHIPKGFTKVD